MLKATCRTKERMGWRVGHILDLSKPTATQNIILNRAAQIVPSGPQKGKKNPSPPTLHQNQLWPLPLWSALPNPAYKLPVSLVVCEVFGVLYICGLSRLCPCPYPSARGRGVWEQLLCPAEHSFLFLKEGTTDRLWAQWQQFPATSTETKCRTACLCSFEIRTCCETWSLVWWSILLYYLACK